MKVVLSSWSVFPFHGNLGINKNVFSLAKYLTQQGVEVEIATSSDGSKDRTKIYNGIKYVLLPPMCYKRKLIAPWHHVYNMNLARYLRKGGFDILHSFTDTAYVYLHLKNRTPVISQPFGLEPFNTPHFVNRRWIKKIYLDILSRHPWRYCITHADAVAMEGEFQNEQLLSFGIPEERLFDLPVGIDVTSIREQLQSQKSSRADLGLESKDFVLISVNRYHSDRGINYLVDAFQIIKQNLPNAKLILIGEAGNQQENMVYQDIINQIDRLGLSADVVCLKNVHEQNLYHYHGLADVYVSPTLLSDFLMSIQEAMVCGLPVVSTGQDFLVKQGVNGYIVPKRNPVAIAEAVITMFNNNEYKAMGSQSLRMVKEYDFNVIASKAIKKYHELIISHKAGR